MPNAILSKARRNQRSFIHSLSTHNETRGIAARLGQKMELKSVRIGTRGRREKVPFSLKVFCSASPGRARVDLGPSRARAVGTFENHSTEPGGTGGGGGGGHSRGFSKTKDFWAYHQQRLYRRRTYRELEEAPSPHREGGGGGTSP